jgi:CDGSH-type Zn-finger protein
VKEIFLLPGDLVYLFLHAKFKYMATTKITVNNNGSLKIEGDFEIVDKNGNLYDLAGRDTVAICRCGLSANKPFCDGSHKGHFEHEAVAFALPPKKVI